MAALLPRAGAPRPVSAPCPLALTPLCIGAAAWRMCQKHRRPNVRSNALTLSAVQPDAPDEFLQKAKDYVFYLNNPEKKQDPGVEAKPKPLVRVRLNVHYRVHSRQMLCIGGSQIPFGWSFLSISKVPMTWNSGDVWTCEVDLPAGERIEYKYVILEEQDWTKQESEDAEGLVEQISYRSGSVPGSPPDVTVIQKQMAIVAWQPGPNRIVQVPTEAEIAALRLGEAVERTPPKPSEGAISPAERIKKPDPFEGTWEVLSLKDEGTPLLDRHDVWGYFPPAQRPPAMRGLNFGS